MGLSEHDNKKVQEASARFPDLYIHVRTLEKRVYTDKEVMQFPLTGPSNPYRKEWAIRRNSARRMMRYLAMKKKPLRLLEVGCGNGWLSHLLSRIRNIEVVGLDINHIELNQAKEVFRDYSNLRFVYGDLQTLPTKETFDVIVFAASIQYFKSLQEIIEASLSRLNHGGEIHILDSRLYKQEELEGARQRSADYFREIECSQMAEFYFHHALETLSGFNYKILYDPGSMFNRFFRPNPFYWIRIKANT